MATIRGWCLEVNAMNEEHYLQGSYDEEVLEGYHNEDDTVYYDQIRAFKERIINKEKALQTNTTCE